MTGKQLRTADFHAEASDSADRTGDGGPVTVVLCGAYRLDRSRTQVRKFKRIDVRVLTTVLGEAPASDTAAVTETAEPAEPAEEQTAPPEAPGEEPPVAPPTS